MGHTRLGTIPKSRKWDAIVALVAGGAGGLPEENIAAIAARTLDAAEPALENCRDDLGLRYTFYLLTHVVLAARHRDWQERLAGVGINLSGNSSLFDLTAEMQTAIDYYVARNGQPTDTAEMAQQAAGEALVSLAGASAATLFGDSGDDLRSAIRDLSTKNGFCRLGQVFFGRFVERFLNFYLSRITASEVGGDRQAHVDSVTRFNNALRTHCEQTARVVRDFCGGWYAKTEFVEGIDIHNTARFMTIVLRKLSRELAKQRSEL